MATKKQTFDPLPDSFLELPDVPGSYAGQGGKAAVVKAAEDGLEFKTVGEFWVAPDDTNSLGWTGIIYPMLVLSKFDGCHFGFRLPDNFTSLMWAKLIMSPDATETLEADFTIAANAVGEDALFNLQYSIGETLAVTANLMAEWEIASFFPALAAGDYVGVEVFNPKTSLLWVVGLAIKYS